MYAVVPGGQENQGQAFVSKHFNVIDPLRINNNLGRSVSKGTYLEIICFWSCACKTIAFNCCLCFFVSGQFRLWFGVESTLYS